jgi:hypothetical protein
MVDIGYPPPDLEHALVLNFYESKESIPTKRSRFPAFPP